MEPNPNGEPGRLPPSPVRSPFGIWPAYRIAAAVALGLCGGTAHATITPYTTAALFTAAAGTAQTDTFDDLAPGTLAAPLHRSAGGVSYSAAVDPDTSNAGVGAVVPPGEFYIAGSAADAWLSANTANDTLRFFNLNGLHAIGGLFFGSDVDGLFQPGVDIDLVATDSAGSFSYTLSAASLGSFIGFVSDLNLRSLTVRAVQPSQGSAWVSANNLRFAQAVPEPGSASLVGLALAGLTMARRRWRRPAMR